VDIAGEAAARQGVRRRLVVSVFGRRVNPDPESAQRGSSKDRS
jgi:hypothetical protein